jgi:preprotein translocase subunit SecD
MNTRRRGLGSKGTAEAETPFDAEAAIEKLARQLPLDCLDLLRPLKTAYADQQQQIQRLTEQLTSLAALVNRLQQQDTAQQEVPASQQDTAPAAQHTTSQPQEPQQQQPQQQQALARRVETVERASRQHQLLLIGLEEDKQKEKRLLAVVTDLIPAAKGSDVTARRMGKKRGSKPRHVLLTFSSNTQKHAVLKHAKELRKKGLFLDSYLTEAQLTTRKQLGRFYHGLKAGNLRPFWREDRLHYTMDGKLCRFRKGDRLPTVCLAAIAPLTFSYMDDPNLIIEFD